VGEDPVTGGLTPAGRAHYHHTETHVEGVKELDHFHREGGDFLESQVCKGFRDLLREVTVIGLGDLDAWE
jgi:hypothetical protein